jgi:hypothetical protein
MRPAHPQLAATRTINTMTCSEHRVEPAEAAPCLATIKFKLHKEGMITPCVSVFPEQLMYKSRQFSFLLVYFFNNRLSLFVFVHTQIS